MEEECKNCEGEELSNCCNAPIIWGDICEDCKEHCDNQCEECETFKTKKS
jgi:hypothetical protein